MSEEKKVPKRRFREFRDAPAWEERKLGDVAVWSKGVGLSKNDLNSHEKGVPTIHYADLYKFASVQYQVIHWTTNNIGTEIPNNNLLFPMSDVTSNGLARTSTILQSNVRAGSDVLIAELNENTLSTFMSYQINKNKNKIIPLITGTTVRHITPQALDSLEIFIPTKNEQKHISSLLDNLDHLVTLQQRKLDKLKNLKKAYLNEMFPAEGENVPKRRFPGFTGAWEEKKLGDIAKSSMGGGTPKTSVKKYWGGTLPWIQSSDLIEDDLFNVDVKKHITKLGIKNSATKIVPKNSIAIVTRVGVGKIAFLSFEYATSQDFLSLNGIVGNPQFIIYALQIAIKRLVHQLQGTSIKGVTKSELLKLPIKVPLEKVEQEKISKLLLNLDHLITLQQRKLNKLKNLKKAYLNEMFV